MSVAANKAVIERHFQGFNEANYDLLDSVTAEHMEHAATLVLAPRWERPKRRPFSRMREAYLFLLTAFPDISFTIENLIGEGDKVVARVRQRGTQAWAFQGVPASGRQMDVQQIHMFRIEDGRTTHRWVVRQDLLMMEQLGAIASARSDAAELRTAPAEPIDEVGPPAGGAISADERRGLVREYLDRAYTPDPDGEAGHQPAPASTVAIVGPLVGSAALPFGPNDDTLPFLRAALPDLTYTVEDLLADGPWLAARLRVRGTNLRSAWGLEPTGRAMDLAHMHVFWVPDRSTLRIWPGRDDLALALQLGLFRSEAESGDTRWVMPAGGAICATTAPTSPVDETPGRSE